MNSARNIWYNPSAKNKGASIGHKECHAALKPELHSQLQHHRTSAVSRRRAQFLLSWHYQRELHTKGPSPSGCPTSQCYFSNPKLFTLDMSRLLHWGTQTGVCLNPFRAKTLLWDAHLLGVMHNLNPCVLNLLLLFLYCLPHYPKPLTHRPAGSRHSSFLLNGNCQCFPFILSAICTLQTHRSPLAPCQKQRAPLPKAAVPNYHTSFSLPEGETHSTPTDRTIIFTFSSPERTGTPQGLRALFSSPAQAHLCQY